MRTAKHSTVTAAAIKVVVSQAWPSSIVVTNWPSFCPKSSLRSNGTAVTSRNVKNAVAALATVITAADAAATSRARSNSRRFGLSAHTASTSAPIMPAAERFVSSFAIGTP